LAQLEAENQRLRRRFQREREARLQAEVIAEEGLRELYERQQQLQLLEAIAGAANQATSVAEALQFTVDAICRFTGWQVGHAFLTQATDGEVQLRSASIWHGNAERLREFYQVTEALTFPSELGLPGRVVASGCPAWVMDLTLDTNFFRARAAADVGFKAALAFPVTVGDEVVAVLEFFADRVLEPDGTLLRLMAQIGHQLGRVVERKRVEDKLIHDAFHDPLTGLPNRALLADRLARALRDGTGVSAVVFLDLDRFKLVNDSLGHLAGDRLIVEVAARLEGCLRDGDTLARTEGDEFAILLENIDEINDAVYVTARIMHALEEPFMIEREQLYVSASIGIASSQSAYASPEEIFRHADLAMHRAKIGKSGYEIFNYSMHEQAVRRLELESSLRRALLNDEFVLHYQPIVSLKTGQIVGVEALVRWRKSEFELIYPADFIEAAEDTGVILQLGISVLCDACKAMARWHAQFPRLRPLTISVNISSRQFTQPDFVQQVGKCIAKAGIKPDSVRLEITESVTMVDSERTVSILQQLRGLDVRISIDDFGTGYSSLSYLHRFPLDFLKIDRSFIAQLDRGNKGVQMVQTIVSLARNLGIEVVAEGIETQTHVAHLTALGCDFGQGYFFSKPLSESAFTALLERVA
jgi:diguanylate cyclase (GGDEF)-like protein